ncbi:thiol-disulfide oxidoreductase DCC family protein [Paenibacillus soyae]|uniref:Thiol-disulfide oxidoreductase DCC family protein n=1 Tax=Paenibacillus soyae TaxID=2969249 RepID=A0A9X2S715_9BACL|nr:thiol-disulfide oxidoreductase DCC family protein [Paenibacillus soyae]MCR2802834.1 thiol-disulfide oxidoreductase DCC family protein [Paenibacillus soyae]
MVRNEAEKRESILLIDGVCHLCQNITRYVVKHDQKRRFSFAALQSAAGKRLLSQGGFSEADWDSFILIENGRYYTKSGAALRVMKGLGGWRSALYGLIVIPSPIRDAAYRFIAKNRYRWFGRSDVCLMPTPDIMSRFLKDGMGSHP